VSDAAAAFAASLRTEKVEEVKYLVEANHAVYRPIVAFLYERLERTETGWVWPNEVFDYIRRMHPDGQAYSEDDCRRNLDTLEQWGVVISEQDVSGATTLEEFLRAARRYQISERCRQIERMVRDLESDVGVLGSLDPGRLRRLWDAIIRINDIISSRPPDQLSPDDLARLEAEWNTCEDTRAQIEEQALRYLRNLTHREQSEQTDLEVFVAYRTLLRNYIDQFLLDLKDFRPRCADLFDDWRSAGLDGQLAAALARNEQRKGDTRSEMELRDVHAGTVRRLMGFPSADGTARILEQRVTTRLLTLISQVERMVLERQSVVDRKRDLERLALAFRHAPSDDRAHEIAAIALGWGTPSHMYVYGAAETDLNPAASAWLQPALQIPLRPTLRGNREFQGVTPVRNRSAERARLRIERAADRERERAFWSTLFRDGEVILQNLTLADATALNRVTRLVRDCMRSSDHQVRLPTGGRVRLELARQPDAVGEVRIPGGVYHTRPFRLVHLGETD
jgi:uncharacterized protein (TIGR02677 family)